MPNLTSIQCSGPMRAVTVQLLPGAIRFLSLMVMTLWPRVSPDMACSPVVLAFFLLSPLVLCDAAMGQQAALAASANSPANAGKNTCAIRTTTEVWRIRGVAIGQSTAPCQPQEQSYANSTAGEGTVQLSCSFGPPNDRTHVLFSPDTRKVVRVARTQYLKPSDPPAGDVLKQAIDFYGAPRQSSMNDEFANYGDAYAITHLSNATQITRTPCGSGLLIKAQSCGDGTFGLEDCQGLGVRYVRYELVDNAAVVRADEVGRQRYLANKKRSLSAIKF